MDLAIADTIRADPAEVIGPEWTRLIGSHADGSILKEGSRTVRRTRTFLTSNPILNVWGDFKEDYLTLE